jgi:hypothetical protein
MGDEGGMIAKGDRGGGNDSMSAAVEGSDAIPAVGEPHAGDCRGADVAICREPKASFSMASERG